MVTISFTVYNFQYDLWLACDYLFELAPGGSISHRRYLQPFKPTMNESRADLSEFYIDIMRVLIAIYIAIFIGIAERKHKTKNHKAGAYYHIALTGIADLGIIICAIIPPVWRLVTFASTKSTAEYMVRVQDNSDVEGFYGSSGMANDYETIFIIEGILFTCIMYRLLSLFRILNPVYMLWHTVGTALRSWFYFMVMAIPLIVGFLFMVQKIWGPYQPKYSSLKKTVIQVYQLIEGDLDVDTMLDQDIVYGTILGVTAYSFITLLLLNIFTAIIVDAYYTVQLTSPASTEKWDSKRLLKWGVPGICVNIFEAAVETATGKSSQDGT